MWKWLHKLFMHSEWKISLGYQLFGAGGVMSSFGLSAWAASASAWLNHYGPIAWVGAGFVGALAFLSALLIYSMIRERIARSKLTEKRNQESTGVNPLDDNFTKEVIAVSEIFSFFHQHLFNKTFRSCRFSGPMVMAFGNNVSVHSPIMSECNFIVVEGGPLNGVVAFSNTTFHDCEFDSVTFVIPPAIARKMQEDVRGGQIEFLGLPLD